MLMRFHYIPIRICKIKKTDHTKYWWGHEATGNLIQYWGACCTTTLETNVMASLKVKNLSIQEKWKYISTHKNVTWKFIASLFVISKHCKQPKCSTGEWIDSGGIFIPHNSNKKKQTIHMHLQWCRPSSKLRLKKRNQTKRLYSV